MKSKELSLAEAWFEKADEDELVVKNILAERQSVPNAACFHSQQMAEKYLKGYLVYGEQEFPKIHQIDRLVKLCSQLDKTFGRLKSEAEYLTIFYVTTRYPGDFPDFTWKDAERAFRSAKKIKKLVLEKVK